MATPQSHKTAKRNLTKNEFRLFNNSLPKNLSSLTERRIKIAHKHTQDLIRKYRKSLTAANQKRQQILSFRLRNLEKTLDRYSKILKASSISSKEAQGKEHHSLTGQPKMRLNRRGTSQQDFNYLERNNIFPMKKEEPHVTARKATPRKRKKSAH